MRFADLGLGLGLGYSTTSFQTEPQSLGLNEQRHFCRSCRLAGGILYSLFWPLQFQVAQVLLLNVSEMLLQNEWTQGGESLANELAQIF